MNLKKFRFEKLAVFIEKRTWTVFAFFLILTFFLLGDLMNSYFEADEWFHFTYYLPLTKKPDGFLTALLSTFTSSGPLSGGQHVIPIASAIYFLNTKFFGMNYAPYAFMSLLLHAVNSFLVFVFIKVLLSKKNIKTRNVFSILGGLFFALSPMPMHAVTGAAPFYGQNVLSVTFSLLSLIVFKLAFIRENKKFIYLSILFLFLSLFTKETSAFLFPLLIFMALIEKRTFSLKLLGKVFFFSILIYAALRFLIPYFYNVSENIQKQTDTGTVASQDISFHKNLPAEILSRTLTFPIRMTGTLFLPRPTTFSIVKLITPIVVPLPDSQARLGFLYGAGNFAVIYLVALFILLFCTRLIFKFVHKKSFDDARALAIGIAIIIFSSLPLVLIIFSFPRWGYDFYFDSRLNYNPNVGAAIIFPFLIFGIANFFAELLKIKKASYIVLVIFTIWFINNMYIFTLTRNQFISKYNSDRREVVSQLKNHLPSLPKIAAFYFETDGKSAYGPNLPFNTGVPQALSVVYYDKDPLPDVFFEKPFFNGKPQGYQYSDGRGFGYYTSKKELSEALIAEQFEVSDIYAFYYEAENVHLADTTSQVRAEMEDYLQETDMHDWQLFEDNLSKIKFLYPSRTTVEEQEKAKNITNPEFNAEMFVINISPSFNINDATLLTLKEAAEKDVYFDKYHFTKATVTKEDIPQYFVRLNDVLIYMKVQNSSPEGLMIIERILGSLEIADEEV